jgi:hypothetical protein
MTTQMFAACGIKLSGKMARVTGLSYAAARAYADEMANDEHFTVAYAETDGAEDPKIVYRAQHNSNKAV